jgi:hypothetical protein
MVIPYESETGPGELGNRELGLGLATGWGEQ